MARREHSFASWRQGHRGHPASPDASLVLRPAQPSTVRPCERWNFSTAARVAGPYLPSTSSLVPSIVERRLHPFRAIGIEARRKRIADLVLCHLGKELLP